MLCLRLAHTQARVTDFKQRGKYENMGELQGPTAQTHGTRHTGAGSRLGRGAALPTAHTPLHQKGEGEVETGGGRQRTPPPQPVHRTEEGRRKKGQKAGSRA